jgi:hypothetical protein
MSLPFNIVSKFKESKLFHLFKFYVYVNANVGLII